MTLSSVKLSQLRLSPLNVRSGKAVGIDALAQDISAHSVIQSLSVYEEGGHYYVFAGGRRFRALKKLVKAKVIGRAYEVPVIVRSIEEAHELSLAENVSRQPMHVADCVVAYGSLRDDLQLEPQVIAMRFGVSPDYVRRVLKLSALAPACLAALAKDEITISTAQALTLTDDHAEQVRLLEQHGDNDWQIKRALTFTKVSMDSGMFRFVGVDAYTQAGGTITRDLFDSRDEGYADHPDLLQSLAQAKLDALAQEARADGWSSVAVSFERPDCYYERIRVVADRETGLIDDDAKAAADLFIFIGRDGSAEKVPLARRNNTGGIGKAKAPKADWAASLVHDLSVTRTMVLQQQVAQRPDVAFNLLLATLIDQLGFGLGSQDSALSLDVKMFALKQDEALTDNDSIAPVYLHDTPIMGQFGEGDSFQIVQQLDDAAKMQLLSHAVAQLLNGVNANPHYGKTRLGKVDAVAKSVRLDMTRHWKATPHLFARAGKTTTLKVLAKEMGQEVATNVAKLKKAQLATVAADRLYGTGWLPPAMMVADGVDKDTSRFGEAGDIEKCDDFKGDDGRYEDADGDDEHQVMAEAA